MDQVTKRLLGILDKGFPNLSIILNPQISTPGFYTFDIRRKSKMPSASFSLTCLLLGVMLLFSFTFAYPQRLDDITISPLLVAEIAPRYQDFGT